jgi:hypothetical protein
MTTGQSGDYVPPGTYMRPDARRRLQPDDGPRDSGYMHSQALAVRAVIADSPSDDELLMLVRIEFGSRWTVTLEEGKWEGRPNVKPTPENAVTAKSAALLVVEMMRAEQKGALNRL